MTRWLLAENPPTGVIDDVTAYTTTMELAQKRYVRREASARADPTGMQSARPGTLRRAVD